MNESSLEYPRKSLQPNYDQYEGGALHELALFAGVGGGLLGTKLLGWRTVCYIEWNDYCIAVLKNRIREGYLDNAPIWDDVSTFDGRPWCGNVDVITAGFPCQPFSVAGKRKGEADERNKWPDTIRVIREVRPRYVFLENVPALLANAYIHIIFRDLAESGYDCQWDCIRASDVGAPHKRERLWIVAYTQRAGLGRDDRSELRAETIRIGSNLVNSDSQRCNDELPVRESTVTRMETTIDSTSNELAYTKNGRQEQPTSNNRSKRWRKAQEQSGTGASRGMFGRDTTKGIERYKRTSTEISKAMANAKSKQSGRIPKRGIQSNVEESCRCRFTPWACCRSHEDERFTRSGICRISHGIPDRIQRLKALGNAQVPAVVATAWRMLTVQQPDLPLMGGGK